LPVCLPEALAALRAISFFFFLLSQRPTAAYGRGIFVQIVCK
jgi:hypothetical protein